MCVESESDTCAVRSSLDTKEEKIKSQLVFQPAA
jgi:hypothetical protein